MPPDSFLLKSHVLYASKDTHAVAPGSAAPSFPQPAPEQRCVPSPSDSRGDEPSRLLTILQRQLVDHVSMTGLFSYGKENYREA